MTKYLDCDTKTLLTKTLLMIESGLKYYDPKIMQELANRAGLGELWESAEERQDFEEVYNQIIMKLTS